MAKLRKARGFRFRRRMTERRRWYRAKAIVRARWGVVSGAILRSKSKHAVEEHMRAYFDVLHREIARHTRWAQDVHHDRRLA